MSSLHPKKLLLSKWTAVHPVAKQKHFLVIQVALPDPDGKIEWVELQATYSGAVQRLAWRDLRDTNCWLQGWV